MIEYLRTRGGGWTIYLCVAHGKSIQERVVLARGVPTKSIARRVAPVLAAAWRSDSR